jgi:hypothetical protein
MRPIELSIAKNGLHILHEVFRLECYSFRSPRLSDAVLIAIDFENINTIKSGFSHKNNCQVGLAVLDTKKINQVSPDKLISTYNFATGSPSYLRKASEKFIFGETITIRPSDMADCIQSSIPPARNIVFVGHGIVNDLQALQALGFQFPVLLSGVLDTFQVANEVFQFWAGSLSDLLLSLGCSFNRLHCAGNDANFTLRALLLLAVQGFTDQQRDQVGDYDTLGILQQISTCPIPHWVDPEVRALEKREKRRERSRKHQSKTWDKEKQEQIRAARKIKKEGITNVG